MRLPLAGVLVVLAGCAGPLAHLTVERRLGLEAGSVLLKTDGTRPQDEVRVQKALAAAQRDLARWGSLATPVTVYVVDSHEQLEHAAGRHGFDALRAWARYDELIVQAPSTWTSNDEELTELFVHELTHARFFQRLGTKTTWREVIVPIWFREGMAVSTAHQMPRYASLEDLASWLGHHPGVSPLTDNEAWIREEAALAYAFAGHAFSFLERRYGPGAVDQMIAGLSAKIPFPEAFVQATGSTFANFEADFLSYLRLRAFRGQGRAKPRFP